MATPLQLAARHSLAIGSNRAKEAHEALVASLPNGLVSEYDAVKDRMHALTDAGSTLESIAGQDTNAGAAGDTNAGAAGDNASKRNLRQMMIYSAVLGVGVIGLGLLMGRRT